MRYSFLILALLGVSIGCGSAPPPDPSVCRLLVVDEEEAPEPGAPYAELTPEQWVDLMRDSTCTEEAVGASAAFACDQVANVTPIADPESRLQVRTIGPGRRIVFLPTHEGEGQVVGRVALARINARGAFIDAIGTVPVLPERLRWSLEPLASRELILADSETCRTEDDCEREVRFFVVDGTSITNGPVYNDDLECVGGARVTMNATREVELQPGRVRKFVLLSAWETEGNSIEVREQVEVHEADPSEGELPPDPFRVVNSTRQIELLLDGWKSTDSSLLDRVRQRDGIVTERRRDE